MKYTSDRYERPEIELIAVGLTRPLATSPLENPEDGEDWDWDD